VSDRPDSLDTSILRPTVVEVSLARLTENFRAIQAAVGAAVVMPIVRRRKRPTSMGVPSSRSSGSKPSTPSS